MGATLKGKNLLPLYKSPCCFVPSFKSNGLLVQEKKSKVDLQESSHGSHLGFPIETFLAIFNLQVTLMLPTKVQVSWPFGSGEEAKRRFSRWRPRQPSWISEWKDFSYFWSTSHLYASYQVSSQLALQLKIDFQDGHHGSHLGFPIGTILSNFDLQCFLPCFKSFGLSVQEKKQKINFQDGCHLGFPIGKIFI